jgi:hypothetical protein
MIVPSPCPSAIVAFVGFVRLTKKVSSGSASVSPMTWTLTIWLVSPGKNMRVPSRAR